MSHDFEPEPHEKAMIDVMLKGNTTPKWIYDFNKFLIEERTTGEIIKFTDELLHQELQKAREQEAHLWFEEWYSRTISKTSLDGKDFGHWATTRLQTLGVDHSDLDQLTTKTNTDDNK